VLVARLYPVFTAAKIKPPKRVRVSKKSPDGSHRAPNGALRAIEAGREMLRHKGQHHTSRLPQELYQRFGLDLNQGEKQ
jgi:hypothetical protein